MNYNYKSISYQDIIYQLIELICYYYKLFRPEILVINQRAIEHLKYSLLEIYPYQTLIDIQIMTFPYESYYSMEECTELVYGKWQIRTDIMDQMKQDMKKYWEFNITSYNAHSDIDVISMSNHPIENFICLTHNMSISIIDLYNY